MQQLLHELRHWRLQAFYIREEIRERNDSKTTVANLEEQLKAVKIVIDTLLDALYEKLRIKYERQIDDATWVLVERFNQLEDAGDTKHRKE